MPDGEIVINTELDNKEAQKELDRLIKKIQKSQQALAEKKDNQSGIAAELKSATDEAIKTEDTVARLMEELNGLKDITNGRAVASPGATIDAYQKQSQISDELKRQEDILKEQNKQAEKIGKKYAEITDKVLVEERALAAARDRAGELQKQIAEQEKAPEIIKATSDAVEKFSMRVKKLAKRVLVFTVIASALRKLKTWFTNVLKTNDQAQKAFAQLKAALLTLAQPIVNVLIPAFVAFVQILARVVAGLARLVSALFGTSAKASANTPPTGIFVSAVLSETAGPVSAKWGLRRRSLRPSVRRSLAAFPWTGQ